MKDRCTVCMERTIFSEINLDAPDRTPRSCVHMESRFNLFGDSVSLGARLVHGLCIMHHRQKPLWKHPMIILSDFCLFGDSYNRDAR